MNQGQRTRTTVLKTHSKQRREPQERRESEQLLPNIRAKRGIYRESGMIQCS